MKDLRARTRWLLQCITATAWCHVLCVECGAIRRILTVESGLYYLEPQFGGQTRTFHRPHLSYLAIDFHYLHFDLQMKVNAGGCTHQLKLDVDSIFNIFISAY